MIRQELIQRIRQHIEEFQWEISEQVTVQIIIPLLYNWRSWQKKPALAPVPLLLPISDNISRRTGDNMR